MRRGLWIVLLGALLPALAWAQPEPGMGGGGFGGGGRGGWRGGGRRGGPQQEADIKSVWESLGLGRDQLDKVHQIFDDQQKSSAPDRADLQAARADMEKMMREDEPDRSAIEKQIDKIEQIQSTLQKSSTWAMLDARALLTPQQRKKLDQILAERRNGPPRGMGANGPEGGEPGGGGR